MARYLSLLVLVLIVSVGPLNSAADPILFNSGADYLHDHPIWGTPGFCCGYSVTDTFTLSSASTVTGIAFSAWAFPGNIPPSSLTWEITTSPNAGVLASGSASLSNSLTLADAGNSRSVYESSFPVNVPLAAGTYWLQLKNGLPSELAWGFAKDSGVSQQFLNGVFRVGPMGTQSFELTGTTDIRSTFHASLDQLSFIFSPLTLDSQQASLGPAITTIAIASQLPGVATTPTITSSDLQNLVGDLVGWVDLIGAKILDVNFEGIRFICPHPDALLCGYPLPGGKVFQASVQSFEYSFVNPGTSS
jgi:hypothetical protein